MIKDYLDATRTAYQYIKENDENQLNSFFKLFKEGLSDDNIELHFIQSPSARSEYITLGDTTHIVIDRQTSLYINAINYAGFYSDNYDDRDFSNELYSAFMFIAIGECFNSGNPCLAQELHETYILNEYNYYYPLSPQDEIIKLYFTFFHEWGHFLSEKNSGNESFQELDKQIDLIFLTHQNSCIKKAEQRNNIEEKLWYSDTYKDIFNKYNKEECVADVISAVQALDAIADDDLFRALINEENYIHKSLISIYQIEQINFIQKLVQLALKNDPLPLENEAHTQNRSEQIVQRMRVSRQSLTSLLEVRKGKKVAEETFNKFTDYLIRVDKLSRRELFPKLYKFINFSSSIDDDCNDREKELAINYLSRELYWRKD